MTLNNGVKMPLVGLGTYQPSSEDAQASTTYALDNGYELIDTANFYVNERGVGRSMCASSKAREDMFLETRIWPSSYESETAIDETLERLGTDYIDLLLLHQHAREIRTGYRHLEEAHKAGKVHAIDISDFTVAELRCLLDKCEIKPTLIQVECHPCFLQTELKALLKEHNIAPQARFPLGGRGNTTIHLPRDP